MEEDYTREDRTPSAQPSGVDPSRRFPGGELRLGAALAAVLAERISQARRTLGDRRRQIYTPRVRQIFQSLWTSVGIQICLFGSGILVARSLGPKGRGVIAIVLVLPAVAAQVACLGVPSAATYFTARNRARWRSIAAHLPGVAAVQACVAIVIMAILEHFFLAHRGSPAHTAGLLVSGTAPLFIAQYYALAVLNGLGELRLWNIYRSAPTAAYTVGLALAVPVGLSVITCALMWLASWLVTTVALLGHLWSKYHAGATEVASLGERVSRRDVVRFGIVGFLAQVSPVETFRIDSLVMAALFPSQIVGYYAVALSVSNPPRFIADGIVAVGYPHVAAQNEADGRASTRRYLLAAAALCGGASLCLAITLPWIIPVVFGSRFAPAIGVSAFLIVTTCLISIRRVGSDCLRGLGRPGAATIIEIITLLALVPTFVALAPWGNGRGVAASLGLCAAIGLILMLIVLRNPTATRPVTAT